MTETQFFTISPQRYVRTAMGVWMGRYAWIGIVPLAGFAVAGINDARFFIVAAALGLLAYPGILMLVYFNHALTKEAAYSVIPHKVVFSENGLEIVYDGGKERPTPPTHTVGKEDIATVEDTGAGMRIILKSGRYDIIEIPAEALPAGRFAEALRQIKGSDVTIPGHAG